MPSPSLSAAVAGVARAVARRTDPDPTDGQLLGRFVRSKDEPAFAELVRRLGPMVLGVCRRITAHTHDADDAFQAAFVVLARRAADVEPREAVRPWLYGVAVRVAREAKAVAAKRRAREVPVAVLPDRAGDAPRPPEQDEAAGVLDEEVGRLPDHLRAAVVLCELNGVGRKDAAARLGIPEGTLSSRLGKARKLLAARLTARGLAFPAVGLAVLAEVAVPARLLAKTSAVATATLPLPAGVAALSHGATRTMFLHKLKLAFAAGLAVLAVAGGLALAAAPRDTPPAADQPAPAPKAAAVKPAAKGPNRILFHKAGHPTLVDPDGKNERRVAEELGPGTRADARLSPDGKRVAIIARLDKPGDPAPDENKPVQKPGGRLYVVAADGSAQPLDLAVDECRTLVWSPDGTEVVTTEFRIPAAKPKPGQKEIRADIAHTRVDVKTGRRGEFNLLGGQLITDWSRDGKHFVTTVMGVEDGRGVVGVRLVPVEGDGKKDLTDPDEQALLGRLSPDGKRLLYVRVDPKGRVRELVVRDVAAGKSVAVGGMPEGGSVVGYCWSPDGKRIAYTRQDAPDGAPPKDVTWTLTVCDPDGKNAKVIATHTAPSQPLDTGGWVDWR